MTRKISDPRRVLRIFGRFAALPVGHLALSRRSVRATASFKNIGQLATSWIQGDKLGWTPAVSRELDFVLESLANTLKADGLNGWDKFRRSRRFSSDAAGYFSIYFMSPALMRMNTDAGSKHLSELHLKIRTINALEKNRIYTVERLIERAREGIGHFSAAGKTTVEDITAALEALTLSLEKNGNIDWIRYAVARGFEILPKSPQSSWSGQLFVRDLPSVLKTIMELSYKPRFSRALEQLFLNGSTFDELSEHFERSRQRFCTIGENFIKMLRRLVWLNDYRGCRFRVSFEYLEPLRHLASKLESEGLRRFSSEEWRKMFTDKYPNFSLHHDAIERFRPASMNRSRRYLLALRWPDILQQAWDLKRDEVLGQERLLLEILGFRIDSRVKNRASIQLLRNERSMALRSSGTEVERILTFVYPNGLALKAIVAELRKKFGQNAPGQTECADLMRTLPKVELGPKKIYRIKLQHLKHKNDRCARVLGDEGRILHYREIFSRAAVSTKTAGGLRVNIMANDSRFVPVSRSGYWGLAEWKIETGSIADAAAKVMSTRKGALSEMKIFDLIRSRRPCAKGSISSMLNADSRFRRVKPLTWELADDAVGKH